METTFGILAVILLVFFEHIPKAHSIQCYKCIIAPYVHRQAGVYKCKDFDYSSKFIVNCPNSTMCVKKVSYEQLASGDKIKGTERDCASQRHLIQNFKNGRWHIETEMVEDAYEEGCFKVNDKGFRTSNTEKCYCLGDLCNSANRTPPHLVFSVLIILYSAIRTLIF